MTAVQTVVEHHAGQLSSIGEQHQAAAFSPFVPSSGNTQGKSLSDLPNPASRALRVVFGSARGFPAAAPQAACVM